MKQKIDSGKLPKEVINLFEIIRIKEICKNVGITKISQKEDNIIFNFDTNEFALDIEYIIKKYSKQIKFSPVLRPYITYKLNKKDDIIKEIKEFLNDSSNK